MTNWDPRELEIPLSFLGAGEYEARIYADGPDADKDATCPSAEYFSCFLFRGGRFG
jgi:hypothetical protein